MNYNYFISLSEKNINDFNITDILPLINNLRSLESSRNKIKLNEFKQTNDIAAMALQLYLSSYSSLVLIIGFLTLLFLWLYYFVVQNMIYLVFRKFPFYKQISYLSAILSSLLIDFIIFTFLFKTKEEYLSESEYDNFRKDFLIAKDYYHWYAFFKI